MSDKAGAKMTDEQIKHMVNRFLQWRLPENFNPDGGISFKTMRNEQSPWPAKNEPVGTNLLDATQAEDVVRYMIEELPAPRDVEQSYEEMQHIKLLNMPIGAVASGQGDAQRIAGLEAHIRRLEGILVGNTRQETADKIFAATDGRMNTRSVWILADELMLAARPAPADVRTREQAAQDCRIFLASDQKDERPYYAENAYGVPLTPVADERPAAQAEPHEYTSTACQHELHDRCRKNCKFCGVGCKCICHKSHQDAQPASGEESVIENESLLKLKKEYNSTRFRRNLPTFEAWLAGKFAVARRAVLAEAEKAIREECAARGWAPDPANWIIAAINRRLSTTAPAKMRESEGA